MKLLKLELTNFKNYKFAEFNFDAKFVCLTGKNGQGKTNILDAIHYLSLTKSFLNPIDNANINHDETFFRIAAEFQKDDNSFHKIVCVLEKNSRKKITVNDKTIERFADHIGEFPIVIISPNDSEIVFSSDERRKFIDSTISQFNKTYLDNLINYNRALTQRNKLLKQIQSQNLPTDLLEPYDKLLNDYAIPIHSERAKFLEDFIPYFREFYIEIAGNNEKVDLIFESDLINESLFSILQRKQNRDIALGHTASGIHREDFSFSILNYPLKKFGSQGQQKSFLIALKLAKQKFMTHKKNMKPILLIDDLHDKLDSTRVARLFNLLNNGLAEQIIITDTQVERLKPLMNEINDLSVYFNIDQGNAKIIE